MFNHHLSDLVIAVQALKDARAARQGVLGEALLGLDASDDARVMALVSQVRRTLPMDAPDSLPSDLRERCEAVLLLADPLMDEALQAIVR